MSTGKLRRYGYAYENVVATGDASARLPMGLTIEDITLKLGGTALTKEMLTSIKLWANRRPIIDASATEIDKINTYKGETANAAYLPIRFLEKAGDTDLDRAVGCLDTTAGLESLVIETHIAGATAPTLRNIITESAPQIAPNGGPAPFAGYVHKLLAYPFSIANGGQLPVVLPFGPKDGAIIKRAHFFHGGHITGATVKHNRNIIHESLKADNEADQVAWGRAPQANVYTIDFMLDGKTGDALDTRDAQTLEWLIDFDAADNGRVLVEYLDPLGHM